MNPDRRDQSEGVKAQRRFSGLTKGSQREMPSLAFRRPQISTAMPSDHERPRRPLIASTTVTVSATLSKMATTSAFVAAIDWLGQIG
jgi:hypothetical protein